MEWFFKPKVQLGLFVNFAFVVFTLVSSTAVGRIDAHWQPAAAEYNSAPIPYAQLPPPSGLARANSFTSGGRVYVSLNNDLTLIKRPGLTLSLSPSLNASARPLADMSPVHLFFTRFSNDQTCAGDCPLVISADGVRVWPRVGRNDVRPPPTNWTRESVPHSSRILSDGSVLESLAAETLSTDVPPDVFVEMIDARRVTIKLGDDSVELSAEKLEALRDMYRQLRPPQSSVAPPKSF